jgi:hypothetical protein
MNGGMRSDSTSVCKPDSKKSKMFQKKAGGDPQTAISGYGG